MYIGAGPQFLLWCFPRVEWLLSESFVLLGYPFPGPLATENGLLLGAFFSVLVGVLRLLASSVLSLGHMRQKENSRNSPL